MEESILNKRLHIRIYGKVQGVGFRQAAREVGIRLSLSGWVQNDGARNRVDVEAQGSSAPLQQFEEWLKQGPSFARVDRIEVEEIPTVSGNKFFDIRATPS
jgi:acylphosphatase